MIENPFLGPPARPSGVKMPHWEAPSPECKYTSWSMVAKSYELFHGFQCFLIDLLRVSYSDFISKHLIVCGVFLLSYYW